MSVRTTRLVIEREVKESARRRSMWILVGLVFLGSLGLTVAPEFLPESDNSGTVALVGTDSLGVTDALDAMTDPEIDTVDADDRAAAELLIEEGDADLGVLLDESPPVVLTEEEGSLATIVQQVLATRLTVESLTSSGLSDAEISDAFAAGQPTLEIVDEERGGREFSAFIIALLLYLLTVMLTSQVASGVAVEKSNRVSEVLLAIVPARSLLFGKVIGVGLIGFATLLVAGLPPLVRSLTGGSLPEGFGTTALASSAWFILGLALYLTLAGALGSLVARQEEVGAVVGPLTMLLVVGYVVSISAGDSTIGLVLSFVPFTSPMVVPYRIAIGAAGPIELALSLTILAASVWVMALLGTEVFRRAIVRTGGRLKLKDLLRSPA